MDIRTLILDILEKRGEVRSADIVKTAKCSRAYANRYFQALRDEGRIVLIGKANKARYVPATESAVKRAKQHEFCTHRILENNNLQEHAVLNQIKVDTVIFQGLPENLAAILDYAFTEMLNNAIEHSNSEKIEITMEKSRFNISFQVIDKGIGIFNNICAKRGLPGSLAAIQDLLKGKQSTAPDSHSGEGIFFTSRIADMLIIQSGRKKLIFNNLLNDIFIKDIRTVAGTKVSFSISRSSQKQLNSVFEEFTDSAFEFTKTEVKVRLYKAEVKYVSRSQARRLLTGLEKFSKIILDFSRLDMIGQGFADEIYRIWAAQYPDKKIEHINANENIELMINRAIAARQSSHNQNPIA